MLKQVQRFYGEIWEAGNKDCLVELCHPDFSFRGSLGTECIGQDAFWRYVQTVRSALSNYQCEIVDTVSENNRVFAKMNFSGIHTGSFLGYEPTGLRVSWQGAALFTFENDLISTLWVLGDVEKLRNLLEGNQSNPIK